MVDTQHFCLRWNNYQSSITSAFENLRDDEDFVDVTLACDGKSLKAHRVVLSACSPYFRELLKSTPCKHPVIVLQDVAFSDLHALVEFIYHGEVNVHQRSLSSFLKTAEVLRVSGLTQQSDQTDRDELSHVRALAAGNHVPSHEKLPDEGFPSGNSPPPTPATPVSTTMQQLFRRSQIRKSEAHTFEPHNENVKRPRLPSPPLNNNDATPTDFSMMKSNHLSSKIEGNGLNEDSSHIEENIKCEPLELTGGNGGAGGNHDDSSDSGAAASDRPPASASSNEHDPEPEHAPTPNFLTPESKLFTPGAYNFSMHALTDHSSMSGLGHGLQTPDLAGTSQDQEVAEEDGGWNDDDDDDDDDDESGPTTYRKNSSGEKSTTEIINVPTSSSSSSSSHSSPDGLKKRIETVSANFRENTDDKNLNNVNNSPVTDEFPMIDLLDDINDRMEIVFKSERTSPKIESVDELESCLMGRGNDFEKLNTEQLRSTDKNSLGISCDRDRVCSGDTDNRGLPSLREVRRRPVEPDVVINAKSATPSTAGTYCSFCQKTFSRAWSLQRHLADTHFYVPQSLSCDQCGRSYKSRNSLVSHKSQYHAKRDRKDVEGHCEISY
ncbi:broad-complex core protein isoforms 1/2/3/4/5 isoform X2 [Athalia rosae]|uniref:broad-complex core protein isoforms 1/2/3/4/5 isoform X2 n=1 Tax=Athalia rosae TaxID=37344 RepID=UPI002033D46B|nr:broad-complex core protein isoforms 1/2/3/4/5 isoform X2 [Athalia rosae]